LFKGGYTRTNGTSQSLADLSLGYASVPKDGLPKIAFLAQSFHHAAKKYKLSAKDGQLVLGGKYLDAVDSRAGALNGPTMLAFRGRMIGMLNAVVLDLDGNGVSLARRRKSRAMFDMNGDGAADDTGWVGKGDGLLVIDRDNDGRITSGSELSFLAENSSAKNSLEALLSLDSNGDKALDKKDARFGELKVWVDSNGNGVSDDGELKTLVELGIVSIGLTAHNLSGSAKPGENLLLVTATFTRENGTVGTLGDAALAFTPGVLPYAGSASPQTAPTPPGDVVPPEVPGQEDPDLPLRRLWPQPVLPVDPSGATGLFAAAANQLASAIAAFGAPASSREIDANKFLPVNPSIILAPTPLH
jgi:hypothetical protein